VDQESGGNLSFSGSRIQGSGKVLKPMRKPRRDV
jgi:hypothetical protein